MNLSTFYRYVFSHRTSPPPHQVPKSKSPAPLGLYELSVVERPPELDVPPPADIFGGDTPAGIGKAGSGEVPVLSGAADRTWRGKRRLSEESAWPEEGQVGWGVFFVVGMDRADRLINENASVPARLKAKHGGFEGRCDPAVSQGFGCSCRRRLPAFSCLSEADGVSMLWCCCGGE